MIKKILIPLLFFVFTTSPLLAASTSSNDTVKKNIISSYKSAENRIKKAKKLEKKGKTDKALKLYKKAFIFLKKANLEKPIDPNTLNYLGFTSRKLGNFEDAEVYYLLGLSLDPDHNGINEYLGELYVVTKRIDLAKERLQVLKSCDCEEYSELKEIIDGTKKSKY
tara:strand:+ start:501 stop:998 length:498 start_codon:yes stop_codon:yes gene_type:complete